MNLFLRVLTAIVLLPVVIASIHLGGISFSVLLIVVGLLLAHEIVSMGLRKKHPLIPAIWPPVIALLATLVFFPGLYSGLLSLWLLLFYFAVIFTFHPQTALDEVAKISFVILVLMYSFLALGVLVCLRNGANGDSDAGRSFIYLALVCTFANDTFAYLFGRWLGKRRLFEKVSQKKTWEGFCAGAIASVVIPFVLMRFFEMAGIELFKGLLTRDLLIVSLGISFLGPLGDLIESRVKRAFGVKDSGVLLPGHGGMFDRIDALLVTLPFTFAYAFFLRSLW